MFSFCQNLSLSTQQRVCEANNIKKIIHRRQGSNISDNTMLRTSKLEVVTKKSKQKIHNSHQSIENDEQLYKPILHLGGNRPHNKSALISFLPSKQFEFSNHLSDAQKFTIKNEILQIEKVKSVQLPKVIFQQKIQKNNQIYRAKHNGHIKFNDSVFRPSIPKARNNIRQQFVIPNISQISQKNNVRSANQQFHNLIISSYTSRPSLLQKQQSQIPKIKKLSQKSDLKSSSQQKTTKIGQSVDKLDSSISTQNNFNKLQGKGLYSNHSRTNSASFNQKVCYFNEKKITSSFIQPQIVNAFNRIQFQPKTPKLFVTFQKPQTQIKLFNPQKSQEIHKKRIFNESFDKSKDNQLIISPQKSSILYDAVSILSRSLRSDDDEESLSVIEQRNFFFQREDYPQQLFKKSIQKYVFFQAGYHSANEDWIIYKNVQQKQNKRLYSIKQFSVEYQKQYNNQYQMYLATRVHNSINSQQQHQSNHYILKLYDALLNKEENKLHLIKEAFKCLLNEHIIHLKNLSLFSSDKKNRLIQQKVKLQNKIQSIFDFFTQNQIFIKPQEILQIEDFALCQSKYGNDIIKYHSLYKLEKKQKKVIQREREDIFSKLKQDFCKKLNNSFRIGNHKATKCCFYHKCQHNLESMRKQLQRQTFQVSEEKNRETARLKLNDLFKKIEESIFNL